MAEWSGMSIGWEPRVSFPLVGVMSSGHKPGHPIGCDKQGVPLRDSHGSIVAFWDNAPGEQPTLYLRGTSSCLVSSSAAAGALPHTRRYCYAVAQQRGRDNKSQQYSFMWKNLQEQDMIMQQSESWAVVFLIG